MERLDRLKRKIESAEDLQSVVKTMKALAAVNIRQYERAVESLGHYARTIEMGLQVLMRNRAGARTAAPRPGTERKLFGAVVFGSDQGMCGQFNEQIASFALAKLDELGIASERRAVLALGERVVARLEDAGQTVEKKYSLPRSFAGTGPVLQGILIAIETWRLERGIEEIVLFHHRPTSGSSYEPQLRFLLPLDMAWLASLGQTPWPARTLPTFTMDWDTLFSSLIRQYFFVALYRGFVESMASENASRLASMQAAQKNIDEQLEDLNAQFHHQRQAAITVELLDIVSGFEALTGKGS